MGSKLDTRYGEGRWTVDVLHPSGDADNMSRLDIEVLEDGQGHVYSWSVCQLVLLWLLSG